MASPVRGQLLLSCQRIANYHTVIESQRRRHQRESHFRQLGCFHREYVWLGTIQQQQGCYEQLMPVSFIVITRVMFAYCRIRTLAQEEPTLICVAVRPGKVDTAVRTVLSLTFHPSQPLLSL